MNKCVVFNTKSGEKLVYRCSNVDEPVIGDHIIVYDLDGSVRTQVRKDKVISYKLYEAAEVSMKP